MNHINKIIDADPHFTIDPISRRIRNESSKKVTLIQGDHNSERFSFELPRFVEGHDMLECNRVEVHFINIENGTSNRHEDMFDVKDMQIHPDNPEHVAFSWLITDNATKYVGSLAFGIRFCCTDTENVADYVWKTAVNKDIKISEGMNTAESVAEEFPDIIAQWEERIFGEVGNAIENINTAKEKALEELREAGAEGIVVDEKLDEESKNPVQNKVVANAFREVKQRFDVIADIDTQKDAGVFVVNDLSAESKLLFVIVKSGAGLATDVTQVLVGIDGYRKWRTLYFYDDDTEAWGDWQDELPNNVVEDDLAKESGYYISATDNTLLLVVDKSTMINGVLNERISQIRFDIEGHRHIREWHSKANDGKGGWSDWLSEHEFLKSVFATKEEIGDIETSLENIIAKYGLGGVSE